MERTRITWWMLLAIFGGIFTAAFNVVDNYVLRKVLIDPSNRLVGPLCYFLAGYVAIALVSGVPALVTAGGNPGVLVWSAQKWAIGSGILSSIGTASYLFASTFLDLSVVIPLVVVGVLWLVQYDVRKKRIDFHKVRVPLAVIILGCITAASPKHLTTSDFLVSGGALLLLVLLGEGPLNLGVICRQNAVEILGKTKEAEAIVVLWSFIWSALTTAGLVLIATIVTTLMTGNPPTIWSLYKHMWKPTIISISILAFLVVASTLINTLAMNKNRDGGSASMVTLLGSVRVLLGVPLSWITLELFPNAFASNSLPLQIWILRWIGAAVILGGLTLLINSQKPG